MLAHMFYICNGYNVQSTHLLMYNVHMYNVHKLYMYNVHMLHMCTFLCTCTHVYVQCKVLYNVHVYIVHMYNVHMHVQCTYHMCDIV